MNEDFDIDSITPSDLKSENFVSRIPIPGVDHLKHNANLKRGSIKDEPLVKYAKEYELYCRWSALPKEMRKPKQLGEFERQHGIPKNYTTILKTREDYQTKRLTYFWEWMMELLPEVVYATYKRAVKNSSRDAQLLVDLISKRMNINKPQMNVGTFVIQGVSQDKIDNLFIRKDYAEGQILPEKKN